MKEHDAIAELRKAVDVAEDVKDLLKPLPVTVEIRGVEVDVEEEGCYFIVLRVCNTGNP